MRRTAPRGSGPAALVGPPTAGGPLAEGGANDERPPVRNIVIPVRVVFRHALERDEINANPTSGLRLPNNIGRRERTASPSEAAELLAALPDNLRPIYATAFYAGLRRGELRGLRWDDVNLAKGVIHVRRSWDDYAGEITPKSAKGTRTVPLTALLNRIYGRQAKSHPQDARRPRQPIVRSGTNTNPLCGCSRQELQGVAFLLVGERPSHCCGAPPL